ncbi:hypothetical protein ACFV4P_28635 [Kitasatospora sp. NPDC059795]|uniref:hypothetical protein n=1 Tax=Kitasatospora sp. NPDC059795 TaxID=3346949 RepID=UPI00364CDECC
MERAELSGRRRAGLVVGLVLMGSGAYLVSGHDEERTARPAPVLFPTAPVSSPAPATPVPSGPERIVLERAPAGELQVIDLDLPSGRSRRVTEDEWRQRDDADRARVDLLMTDASTAEFEVQPGAGRTGGVLAPFGAATRETCQRAAGNGSLMKKFRIGTADRSALAHDGLQRGSSICVVTDGRQLVQLTVVDQTFDNASIGTVGRLTVTVTPLGPVTD